MTDIVTLNPNANVGNATTSLGTPLILDSLLVQDCRLFFPKLPDVQFSLQRIALPTITVNEVKQLTRYVDPNQIGEKVVYQPFRTSFVVDKHMRNWSAAFNWMKRMTANGTIVGETDNAVLIIGNSPTLEFVDAWPTMIGGFEFDATNPEAQYVICDLVLNYDYTNYIGAYATSDSSYK